MSSWIKVGLQYIDDHTASKDVTNVINFYDLQYFGENLQRLSVEPPILESA